MLMEKKRLTLNRHTSQSTINYQGHTQLRIA